jgi:hypothetical protein
MNTIDQYVIELLRSGATGTATDWIENEAEFNGETVTVVIGFGEGCDNPVSCFILRNGKDISHEVIKAA